MTIADLIHEAREGGAFVLSLVRNKSGDEIVTLSTNGATRAFLAQGDRIASLDPIDEGCIKRAREALACQA